LSTSQRASLPANVVLPDPWRPAAQQLLQLFLNDPDDLLPRREALENLLAHRPRLDLGDEVLGNSQVDVSLEERPPHVAQAFPHIVRRQPRLPRELADDALESIAQCFEHLPTRKMERGG
jgi:hypothetical protein